MICNFRALSGIRLQELCLVARHSSQQTRDKSDIHSPTKVGYGGTDISEPIVPVCSIAQIFIRINNRFSGVGRPAVKGTVDKTARPIRTSMINQSADNAQTPVGIAFLEEERIGREVPVKFDLARMMGILLTAFEALQTFPKRAVADAFGVLHYLIVVLLTHDFHKA